MGKLIGTKQFAEFAAAVIRNLPRDINPNSAQYWIVNQEELEERLKTALVVAEYEAPALPTEMTVGGVTYEILAILREGEKFVVGDVMIERAKEMNANLGNDDCDRLLAHQKEIPTVLRNKIVFVFPDSRDPEDDQGVAFVYWEGDCWCRSWYWLEGNWRDGDCLLRRKSA